VRIDESQLLDVKKTDTLIIYGCGYSLWDITEQEWQKLSQYDSMGFNWFIWQDWISPTYELAGGIRWDKFSEKLGKTKEEAHNSYRDRVKDNPHLYANTVFLVTNEQSKLLKGGPSKQFIIERINFWELEDLKFTYFVYETSQTICALQFAIKMGYKKVVYVGVDLYDYRYFFLEKNQLRRVATGCMRRKRPPKYKKPDINAIHIGKPKVCGMFIKYPEIFDFVEVYSYNPKSLLLEIPQIKVWRFDNEYSINTNR